MPTALLTDHERTAVQAYLRLLHTVRATLDTAEGSARPALVPAAVLADAERALTGGVAGNEAEFFALLRAWCPEEGG